MSEEIHIPETSPNSRLLEEIKRLSASITDIADKTGIARRTLYDLMEDGNSIKVEYLIKMRENYNIDTNYILTGVRENVRSEVNEDLQVYLSIDDEFTKVPYYRGIKAGAGYGLIEEEYESHSIAFRHYFVKETLRAKASELLALRIGGNSMDPLMKDGDDILVDRDRRKIKEGPAYLIRIDDEIFVKYLSRIPNKQLKIWSENKSFEAFTVELENPDFEVIGQVVWHAHVSEYL